MWEHRNTHLHSCTWTLPSQGTARGAVNPPCAWFLSALIFMAAHQDTFCLHSANENSLDTYYTGLSKDGENLLERPSSTVSVEMNMSLWAPYSKLTTQYGTMHLEHLNLFKLVSSCHPYSFSGGCPILADGVKMGQLFQTQY